jgi:excinuclease ABC subunit A
VSQALVELMRAHLGHEPDAEDAEGEPASGRADRDRRPHRAGVDASAAGRVDQKPIGRTPRSNLATYTGLFDHVRKLFAARDRRARAVRRRALSPSTSPRALRDLRGRRAS